MSASTAQITSSTVDDVLRRSAARHPDRVALVFADRTWTYAALDDAVSRAAAHLLGLGLTGGDRVATFGANSDAYLLAFLGCARAGLVHVPVNYALTGEELAYLLAQSGAASRSSTRRCATTSRPCAPTPTSSRCCCSTARDDAVLAAARTRGRRAQRSTSASPTTTSSSCSTPRARRRSPRAR